MVTRKLIIKVHLSKELSLSVNFLSTQVSTTDFYILTKSITSYNNKSLQKSLYTQQKSYLHWRGIATCLYSQLTKVLLISRNMNYPRKNLIYLKQVNTFQSNEIKSDIPKSRFKVGSSLRFWNLEVSEIISWIALL